MPITRQSYFQPTQISGCISWYDATDSSTITLSSGSLTQWNDKSGNGRNLTAVSGFANATVSSAYQNGLNVFNFSGNGLYRTAAGNVSYPQDVYIIVALKSLTTHVDVLGMGDTASDNFNSLTFAESAASRWHNGSSFGARQTISTTDETSLSFLLIQWSIANSNYLLRRNGIQLIQASQTYSFNAPSTSAFQIGFRHPNINSANFSGYIGEIVVFNSQIESTQRQQVETYLAQKWGLTSSLPTGHPGLTSIVYRNLQTTFTKKQYFTAFSPKSVPNCLIWFDAADSSTLGLTGTTVNTWTSKGSYTGSAAASTGTVVSGTVTQNGLNVVRFVAGTQLAFTMAVPNQARAWFSVTRCTTQLSQATSPSFWGIIDSPSSGAGEEAISGQVFGVPGTNSYTVSLLQTGIADIVKTTTAADSYQIWTIISHVNSAVSTANNIITINGTSQTLVTSSLASGYRTSSYTKIINKASLNSGMDVGEIIMYNGEITATQRQQVESYLAQKWGLVSSLPAGHLNATFPAGSPTAIQPYVTSVKTALTFQGRPPSAVGSVSIASLTTTTAVFTWSSGTLATSYNFYIITPSGTSTLVASNIAYSAGATTITFSSTLTYAAGNWTGGVQSVNQYGSSTTVLSGTTTMATPFPYSLNPITTASKTNFVFRDTRRQTQTPAYYWTHCIQLSGGSYAELRTDYSNANSYVSVNSSGGDIFSAGETDPYGNTLFYYIENGFSGNSYKHYVRAVSGLDTAGFIAGTKTASPSVSIQLGNGTYLTNNKTAALYSDNGYYL